MVPAVSSLGNGQKPKVLLDIIDNASVKGNNSDDGDQEQQLGGQNTEPSFIIIAACS